MTKQKDFILVTGANGEVGHGLIKQLSSNFNIIAFDINKLDNQLKPHISSFIQGDIRDKNTLENIFHKYRINTVYHLAAILSTLGEKKPELSYEVNVIGTYYLLSIINKIAFSEKRVIKFIFPSTIAVYGMPDLMTKRNHKKVSESEYLNPITMYGNNKLACENLGIYYSKYYQLLSAKNRYLDFRCVRFPGLISADTIPSGGTSDYASEILHYAAKKEVYKCFVRPDSIIHFMAMPDAIRALQLLTRSPRNKLKRLVYNISGFSVSAREIEKMVKKHFPKTEISYKVNIERQKIIDSWSEDINDSQAKKDWGWSAEYNFKTAFEKYLIPSIKIRYRLI